MDPPHGQIRCLSRDCPRMQVGSRYTHGRLRQSGSHRQSQQAPLQGSRALQYRGEAPTFFEKLKGLTFEDKVLAAVGQAQSGGGRNHTLRSSSEGSQVPVSSGPALRTKREKLMLSRTTRLNASRPLEDSCFEVFDRWRHCRPQLYDHFRRDRFQRASALFYP